LTEDEEPPGRPRVISETPPTTTPQQSIDLGTIAPDEVWGPRVTREISSTLRLGFQEFVRAGLAFIFAALLFIIVILAFRTVGSDPDWDNTKELLQVLLPAVTALLGSALGFYFGARNR